MCAASISLLRFRKPRGVTSLGSIRPILDERIGWPILLLRPILRNPSPGQRIRRGCERKYGPRIPESGDPSPHRTNLRAASAAVASRLRPGAPRSGAGVSHNGTKKAGETGSGDWLVGGGEMGKLVRSMDWARTPLGDISRWPQSLRTTVSLCLASNFPISLAWGPKHIQIYNDGYWPICGGKHPHSMGQDFSECWASAWPAIGEAFERALAGETSYLENQRMFLDRNGYLEETFFTFSFSPIRDETGGVGGLFHPVTETTSRMLSERRTRALRDLSARTGKAQTLDEVLTLSAETLSEFELDVPFALFYRLDAQGNEARLVAATSGVPEAVALPTVGGEGPQAAVWPLIAVVRASRALHVDDLERRCGTFSCGPYPEPPKTALALPIIPPGAERPTAML